MHGAPFWAWNGKLDPEILKKQIRIFKKMGFGGFYMHSRTGLETEYLSEEWFKNVDVCIAEAEKLGLLAYLYDEDRWPSGAAGSLVTSDDRFKAQRLFCTTEAEVENGNLLAVFAVTFADGRIKSMHRLEKVPETLNDDTKIYYFHQILMESSPWYNNAAYLNTLDPAAVRRFIETTHEKYAQRYQDKFSKSIPAIFTDEPCYMHGNNSARLPWTENLPDEFQKRYNYDLTEHLPELFFEVRGDVCKAKHDFYDLLTSLFAENFFGEISGWCDEHDLKLCGHLLAEDQLNFQRSYIGNAMRCYEKMQIPGIDVLTEHWNIFNTAKQCTSAAHQLGRKERLSETYGCTGWDFPLFGHKALGDWQYASGINRRCLHLSFYSMAGEAKRDYPASFLNHSPWYQKYDIIENHFARLSAVMSNDDEIRDLLVINPIESTWSVAVVPCPEQPKPTGLLDKLDANHTALTNLLLTENLDFDFGDEEMMSRLAAIDGKNLKVGQTAYRQILIPELKTIRSTTLELLAKFKGKIFYIGEIPQFVDAVYSPKAVEFYKNFIPVSMQDVTEKIAADFRRVSICDSGKKQAPATLYRLADCADGYTFFLHNFSMEFTSNHMNAPMIRDRKIKYPRLEIEINVTFRGNIAEFDTENDIIHPVKYIYENGRYKFETSLENLQSRLFLIGNEFDAYQQEEKSAPALQNITLQDGEYDYKLDEKNLLVLDHAAWETPQKVQKSPQYILACDNELRELIGEAPRSGRMLQPWFSKRYTENKTHKNIPLKLFYTFECTEIPQNECLLTIENPDKFIIYINGSKLEQISGGYYLDPALVDLKLDNKLLKKGVNQIILDCPAFDFQTNLEAIFIRGDFGVKNGKITTLPEKITLKDWCSQGLENYAGNVTYFAEIDNPESCKIQFPDWRGTLLSIKINNSEEKILLMPPFAAELPQGRCKLEITVYGHLRNAFGPFFINEKWPMLSSSAMFKNYETPIRQLVPCGINANSQDYLKSF